MERQRGQRGQRGQRRAQNESTEPDAAAHPISPSIPSIPVGMRCQRILAGGPPSSGSDSPPIAIPDPSAAANHGRPSLLASAVFFHLIVAPAPTELKAIPE